MPNLPTDLLQNAAVRADWVSSAKPDSHAEAAARAREAGLLVVQNACMRAMHRHIFNVQDW